MKQFFLLLLLVGVMYSCTNEADRIPATPVHAAVVAPDLHLDHNNLKWSADESTTASIESMQLLMQIFATGNNAGSVAAYQELAKMLTGEVNSMVRQCTMTGPAHDEFHKFLTPVLKEIEIMKGNNLEASTAAQLRLEERLSVYQTFFE